MKKYEARKQDDGTYLLVQVNEKGFAIATGGVLYGFGIATDVVNLLNGKDPVEVETLRIDVEIWRKLYRDAVHVMRQLAELLDGDLPEELKGAVEWHDED